MLASINMSMNNKKYLLVEDNPDLVRDKYSKAISNTNKNAYHTYMKKASLRSQQKMEIEKLNAEVSELKTMIKQLLERK